MTTDRMLGMVGNDVKRVIPVHEERLKDMFPSRLNKDGLAGDRDLPGERREEPGELIAGALAGGRALPAISRRRRRSGRGPLLDASLSP